MAFVTDSNRPQPLWQPPPTACLTASGGTSEVPSLLMHPCPCHFGPLFGTSGPDHRHHSSHARTYTRARNCTPLPELERMQPLLSTAYRPFNPQRSPPYTAPLGERVGSPQPPLTPWPFRSTTLPQARDEPRVQAHGRGPTAHQRDGPLRSSTGAPALSRGRAGPFPMLGTLPPIANRNWQDMNPASPSVSCGVVCDLQSPPEASSRSQP